MDIQIFAKPPIVPDMKDMQAVYINVTKMFYIEIDSRLDRHSGLITGVLPTKLIEHCDIIYSQYDNEFRKYKNYQSLTYEKLQSIKHAKRFSIIEAAYLKKEYSWNTQEVLKRA